MRRTRGSVVKSDHGTHQQKHSAVHSERMSLHERHPVKAKVLGPKRGGKG